jgi:hypothetical protein
VPRPVFLMGTAFRDHGGQRRSVQWCEARRNHSGSPDVVGAQARRRPAEGPSGQPSGFGRDRRQRGDRSDRASRGPLRREPAATQRVQVRGAHAGVPRGPHAARRAVSGASRLPGRQRDPAGRRGPGRRVDRDRFGRAGLRRGAPAVGRSSIDQYRVAEGQFTIGRPGSGEGVQRWPSPVSNTRRCRLLADPVLSLHVAVVVFFVRGLVLAVGGNLRAWRGVNAPRFRLGHAAAIAIVVARAWFGAVCPLTAVQMWLRAGARLAATTSGLGRAPAATPAVPRGAGLDVHGGMVAVRAGPGRAMVVLSAKVQAARA